MHSVIAYTSTAATLISCSFFRQRWPHLHQVNRDPYTGLFYMVPDLGRDQVHMFDIRGGKVRHLGHQQLRRGLGPRHMDFNRRLKVVYICGELDNTITVCRCRLFQSSSSSQQQSQQWQNHKTLSTFY